MSPRLKQQKPDSCFDQMERLSLSGKEPLCCSRDSVEPVDCIVLAAGLSSRMGSSPDCWKMLLPLPAPSSNSLANASSLNSILDHTIANALSFCQRVLLVVGHRHQELVARYQHCERIKLIHNPDFQSGQRSSVVLGLRSVTTDYAFITLGDLPFVTREAFSEVWALRGERTVFPAFEGQTGHPVLIPASLIPGLLVEKSSDAERGLKKRLLKNCQLVDVSCDGVVRDIDTPEAYFAETGLKSFSPQRHGGTERSYLIKSKSS